MTRSNGTPNFEKTLEATEVPAVPAGTYAAVFRGVERAQTQYGEKFRWHWTLPEAGGFELTQMTGTTTTGGSNCALNVRALLGRPLVARPRESIPWATLEGVAVSLRLGINPESGWNIVEAVTQLPPSAGGPPQGGFPMASAAAQAVSFGEQFAARSAAAQVAAFGSADGEGL